MGAFKLTAWAMQGSLIGLRVWLAGSPMRLTGLWLVLSGMVATAGLRVGDLELFPVLLTLLLADAVWGALWAQLAVEADGKMLHGPQLVRGLPYATAQGPIGRSLPAMEQVLGSLPLLIGAGLMAWALSPAAVLLTLAVIALALLHRLVQHADQLQLARWLQSLAQGALPFAMGISVAGGVSWWHWQGLSLMLAAAFLVRAGLALVHEESGRLLSAGLGSALVAGTLLANGQPLAATIAVLLAGGPFLLLIRSGTGHLAAVQAWWWLLTGAASVALGLGIG